MYGLTSTSPYLLSNHGPAEEQYLDLVRRLLGPQVDVRPDRTGTGTRSIHGYTMRFDCRPTLEMKAQGLSGYVPMLTTKRVPWKSVVHELLWFLNGDTHIRNLLKHGVTIWSEWPHQRYVKETGHALSIKEFEQRILQDDAFAAEWDDLGPVYGKQWRRWEGPDGQVFDQLSDLVERIRRDPYSRRLLFHGWNVAELEQMALPPCHLLYQFYVSSEGELSLTLYQRSADVGLGVPFNIASASLLIHLMAKQTGLIPGDLFWVGHDVHVYHNHIKGLSEQIQRTPGTFPALRIAQQARDLFSYQMEDLILEGYTPQGKIKMDVAV